MNEEGSSSPHGAEDSDVEGGALRDPLIVKTLHQDGMSQKVSQSGGVRDVSKVSIAKSGTSGGGYHDYSPDVSPKQNRRFARIASSLSAVSTELSSAQKARQSYLGTESNSGNWFLQNRLNSYINLAWGIMLVLLGGAITTYGLYTIARDNWDKLYPGAGVS